MNGTTDQIIRSIARAEMPRRGRVVQHYYGQENIVQIPRTIELDVRLVRSSVSCHIGRSKSTSWVYRLSYLRKWLTSLALATTPVLCSRYSPHGGRISYTNSHKSHRAGTNPIANAAQRPDSVRRDRRRERFGNAATPDMSFDVIHKKTRPAPPSPPLAGTRSDCAAATQNLLEYPPMLRTGRNPLAYGEMCKTGTNPLIGQETFR